MIFDRTHCDRIYRCNGQVMPADSDINLNRQVSRDSGQVIGSYRYQGSPNLSFEAVLAGSPSAAQHLNRGVGLPTSPIGASSIRCRILLYQLAGQNKRA
jgi:hypothetical protein